MQDPDSKLRSLMALWSPFLSRRRSTMKTSRVRETWLQTGIEQKQPEHARKFATTWRPPLPHRGVCLDLAPFWWSFIQDSTILGKFLEIQHACIAFFSRPSAENLGMSCTPNFLDRQILIDFEVQKAENFPRAFGARKKTRFLLHFWTFWQNIFFRRFAPKNL